MMRDIAFALRTLRRSPVFTVVVVITLALGIGSTTAMFSIVDAVMLRGLPYRDANRLFSVYEHSEDGHDRVASYPTFTDWREQAASVSSAIDGLAFVRGGAVTLPGSSADDDRPTAITAFVSPGFFDVMGARPILGRAFGADDERAGGPAVAVISYDLFLQRFGGDPATIGKVMQVDSVPTTIIGVMPRGFAFPNFGGSSWFPASLWQPIELFRSTHAALSLRGLHVDSRVVMRLHAGADSAYAVAAMRTMQRRLADAYPAEQAHWTSLTLEPIGDQLFGPMRPAILLLSSAVTLVLLLACATIANLLLVRGTARARELAVRTALGATRWRIARQLLTETLLLTITAGALGIFLASRCMAIVRQVAAFQIPFAKELAIDGRVALFALAASLGTALLVGIVPAWRAGGDRAIERLRSGTTAAIGGVGERRIRGALVSVQFALALTLLVGAGLLVQSFRRLQSIPLGYDPTNVIDFIIAPPRIKYDDPAAAAALYARLLDAVRAVPSVQDVAAAGGAILPTNVLTDGWPTDRPPLQARYHTVSADYARTLRIGVVAGRWFTADDMRSPDGFVINQALAKTLWPGENAIGKRITVYRQSQARADFGRPITMLVIGVVPDTYDDQRKADPEVFLPYTLEVWPWMSFIARAPNPAATVAAVTRAVRSVDPSIVFRAKPKPRELGRGDPQQRFVLMTLGAFAGCALLLAAIGLYGITAYSVAQRTREVGIRIALGASGRNVLMLILRDGILFVAIGAGLGLAGALVSTRLIKSMLFETTQTDAPTFVAVTLLLAAVAFAASYVPARRAMKTDPMIAIRTE